MSHTPEQAQRVHHADDIAPQPGDHAPATAFDEAGQYRRDADPRSLGEIASDALDNASTLIRQEVELAKVELKQSATRAGKGAGFFSGAAVTGYLGLLFLSLAAWWGIAILIGSYAEPAVGWSGLIVGVIYLVIALILAMTGKSEFTKMKGLPKTTETVSKIPAAATGHEEKNR
ncbi:phage holin family protein [Tessaracoccus sp. ZS01]|uniref:phage holin family protein n=1 Tax=Tessaracoccus sp. ZS01 TaxID=1906324 RepID=UPI0009FAD434|nr:phage holin family protein [Tessaracoccus sp. ZS01]MCG6567874.1 phage holin family protein [Tessaracoccus sp. ZS01]